MKARWGQCRVRSRSGGAATARDRPVRLLRRADGVVPRDEPYLAVFAELAEVQGAVPAADAGQVLDDHQVNPAGLDRLLGLEQLAAVQPLAASLAGDRVPVDRAVVAVGDP